MPPRRGILRAVSRHATVSPWKTWLRRAGYVLVFLLLVGWLCEGFDPLPRWWHRPAEPSVTQLQRRLRVRPTRVHVPPQTDPWELWARRMHDPEQLFRAVAESPRWLPTHREETLLVLLHTASYGCGTVWRPDPIMARILLQQLHDDTPELLVPTLDVAPEDQLGDPIPWPSELFAAAQQAQRRDTVPTLFTAAAVHTENPFAAPRSRLPMPEERPIILAPAFDVLMDLAGAQNVHDHAAQQTAQRGVQNLPEAPRVLPKGWSVDEVRRKLRGGIPEISKEEQRQALDVLEALRPETHSRFGLSEQEALDRVWLRIQDPVNQERQKDLLYTLGKSLASGVENGAVVCSTGRMMRVLGSLDGADAEGVMNIRSDQQVNEELRQFVAHQRDQLLQESSPQDRTRYDEDDAAILEQLRQKITEKAEHEYVQPGILQKSVLNQKLGELLQYL